MHLWHRLLLALPALALAAPARAEHPLGRHLTFALAAHDLDAVKRALRRDPDVARSRYEGKSLLNRAVEFEFYAGAEQLRAHGARLDAFTAAALGRRRELTVLLRARPDLVAEQDKSERTPLHYAALAGQVETVRLLVTHGAAVGATDREQETPLHLAVSRGHKRAVEALLARKADANAKNEDGDTPLHLAARAAQLGAVRALLARGASVKAVNARGTALLDALIEGTHPEDNPLAERPAPLEVARVLLDHKAPLVDGEGNPLANFGAPRPLRRLLLERSPRDDIFKAACLGRVERASALLDDDPGSIAPRSAHASEGEAPDTPLFWAVECERKAVVVLLLRRGALRPAALNANGPALVLAAETGRLGLLELLLGALPAGKAGQRWRDAALRRAVAGSQREAVALLLTRKARADVRDESGTLLHLAVARADALSPLMEHLAWPRPRIAPKEAPRADALLPLLVAHGAPLDARDRRGRTALHLAAEGGRAGAVRYLAWAGANVNALDKSKRTPLDYAALRGQTSAAAVLVAHGASISGYTLSLALPRPRPLIWCGNDLMTDERVWRLRTGGPPALAELLLARRVKLDLAGVDFEEVLHEGLERGGWDRTLKLLIERGAKVDAHLLAAAGTVEQVRARWKDKPGLTNARNKDRSTPLHEAAVTGNLPVVRFLLDDGADVNARDRWGRTALHRAIQGGRAPVVELLLARKADASLRGYEGRTPLHEAIVRVRPGLVRRLIAHKVDVNARDEEGRTALTLAEAEGLDDVARWLRAAGAKE